ncbi:MAG: NIPSNAP family protein [Opitutaceae bacterium]
MCSVATDAFVADDGPVYELRSYTALPGKLPDVIALSPIARALFAKYGVVGVGYFVPVEQKNGDRFVYILKHASREAAAASWKAFRADPEWIAAQVASGWPENVINAWESTFLAATDYSPAEIPALSASHVYELRTYTCNEGKLDDLDARFRDHTMKLFSKHGMTNVLYTHPTDEDKGAGRTLVYLLAHDSVDAAKASFDAFRQDPDWVTARNASEANGKLLVDGGVKTVFLEPLPFSPLQ